MTAQLINKVFSRIFFWVLLIPAFLPLVYVTGLLYPYVTLKTLLFRGLGIVAFALFIYLVSIGWPFFWGRLRRKISWLPAGLLVVAYFTSAFGLNFYNSFWSSFNRGDGLLTLSVAVLFFYLILISADHKFLNRLLKAVVFTASLVAIQAIFQWLEISFGLNLPLAFETANRLGGTLGNAAFLASYLGLTTFISFYLAGSLNRTWRRAVLVSGVVQILVIFLTATRGTILALLIVGFLAVLCSAFKKADDSSLQKKARIGVAIILLAGVAFIFFRPQIASLNVLGLSRLATISFSDSTVANRLFAWRGLLSEGLKHPILGYGAESINVPYNLVYDPGKTSEQWFDRSHNSFLDYFIQYGLVGLLIYLALIVSLLFLGFGLRKTNPKLAAYLVALTLLYSIQNFFVFDTAMTFWLFLVLLVLALVSSEQEVNASLTVLPKSQIVGSIIAILVLVLLWPTVINPFLANYLLAKGYTNHVSDPVKAIASLDKGFALNTYANLEYGYQAYSMYAEHQVNSVSGGDLVSAYRYAVKVLSVNFVDYPEDARTATYLGHVIDLAPKGVDRDNDLLLKAVNRAIGLSPKSVQPRLLLANVFIREGDLPNAGLRENFYLKAIQELKNYLEIVPDSSEINYVIASLYLGIGKMTEATKFADRGMSTYVGDERAASRAAGYYIKVEDWPNALKFLKIFVDANPQDYNSLYDLAKLYFLTGDRDSAVKIVEDLKIKKPGLVETDPAFLGAILVI